MAARRFDPVTPLVRPIDAVLRRYYGIREFTDDPACIFRLSRERAWRRLRLADGTPIAPGSWVGELHFWSEHMPKFAKRGPDIAWATDMYRHLRRSFTLLAIALRDDPAWRDLSAVFGRWAFAGGFGGSHHQPRLLMHAFGLEPFAPDRAFKQRIHDLMEDFLLWGMLRAFNPHALDSHDFFRSREELWVSRAVLLARLGMGRPPRPRRIAAEPAA
ncbi:MAG: YkoP family protein [Acetobacteraceae bacterium]